MKLQKIENGIISFAKAMPLVTGAASGLVKPAKMLFHGQDAEGAFNEMVANYTFYDPSSGSFNPNKGIGVKGLAIGTIISKGISWLTS